MKKVIIFINLFFIITCATKPQLYEFEKTRIINADFDMVWTAVIEIFADQNIPIINMEKASGLIVSDRIYVDPPNCDCGKDEWGSAGNRWGCLGVFNVFVKKVNGFKTSIMITVKYNPSSTQGSLVIHSCTSTGLLETYLFKSIMNKAESLKEN